MNVSHGDVHVATDYISHWQEMDSAPCGYKCLLLTIGGIAVIGEPHTTSLADGYIGWAPLPRIPPRIKALIRY